jgi:hypothetical protein
VTVEELRAVAKRELSNKLHPWITQREMTVNEKNLPTFLIDQVIAFAFMSNKPDAIEVDNSDRRYLVIDTKAKPHREGSRYYQRLYGKNYVGGLLQDDAALGAVLYQLQNRDLGEYDITGPAPNTAAKMAMKAASANDISQWIAEHDGEAPFNRRVFTMDEIEKSLPSFMRARVSMRTLRDALEFVGAVPWPDQIRPNSRTGDKVRVWVRADIAAADNRNADVLRMYREDQNDDRIAAPASLRDKDDSPALTDFGDAIDDFGEPGRTLN